MNRRLKNNFKRIVEKVSKEDSAQKYLIEKIADNKYRYHKFMIIKDADGFFQCKHKGKIIFEDIATLRLATMYCYNDMFKHSKRIRKELDSLNKQISKNRQDMLYYRYYLKGNRDKDNGHMFARIQESELVYERLKNEVRNLSTSI